MSYATVADFKARVPERAYTGIPDPIILQHLADASAILDSYLYGKGYPVIPLPSVGNDVKGYMVSIALWTILRVKGKSTEDEDARLGYEDAMRWLDRVADGTINLAPGGGTPPRNGMGLAQVFSASDDDESGGRWV